MVPPEPARVAADQSAARAETGPARPPRRRRRWRRRLAILAGVLAAAYGALWLVRLTRDVVPVRQRPFLNGGPLVIAHRGASGVESEHTISSYRRALADGAEVLELDVHRSRDGAIVVSHDATLERRFGVARAIADSDLPALRAELARRFPASDPATLLPTLDEVLAAFPEARLNIELKADSAALADAVAAAIERHGRADDVLVASFHGGALARFRASSHGRVATSASLREAARFYACYLLDVACRPEFEALQVPIRLRSSWPRFPLDSSDFIAFAHRHGLAVHYWTIDDPAEMTRLLAAGADGIMTNYPARAIAARAAARR
ncbi:MAG TPA: glycerophosphodiester phosphodiesterase family protein [Kofleriaceae bacterium]|nr:glycerophosphodiester phosphodiesterase family protein [Kofleriaceae bacterium]